MDSRAVTYRLSCPLACGIFPDHGSNACLLHWQADSLSLSHRGSPHPHLYDCASLGVFSRPFTTQNSLCFSEQFLLFLFLFPVLSPTLVQGQTVFKASPTPVSVRRGDPERISLPRRPPSLRASTHSIQPTGSLLGPTHQGSGLVSRPSRGFPGESS